jgi:LacI family transcriptional regulator
MNGNQSIKLDDIARALGISKATVSNALTGNRYVSQKTIQRVHEACSRYGYTVNYLAQSLRTRTTRTIGVTVPNISEPLISTILHYVEQNLKKRGYEMLLGSYYFDPKEEIRLLGTFRRMRVDGILAVSGQDDMEERYLEAAAAVPVVFLERDPGDLPISCVMTDYYKSGVEIVRFLRSKGHSRIGYLTIRYDNFRKLKHRLDGYLDELKRTDGNGARPIVIEEPRLIMHEVDSTLKLASRLRQRIHESGATAMHVVSDYIAVSLVKAFSDLGVRIPGELAMIGFGNVDYCRVCTPRLSSFDPDARKLGARAVSVLLDLINKTVTGPVREYVPFSIVERETT